MARIPDYEIERLKKEISVERLAEARGIQLTRHGADLVGKCPFHDDRTPSLVITPAKNLWHCLGACHAGGTAIDWIMRAEGISFRHAVELLRADHLPLAPSPNQPVKHGTVRKLPPPIAREADDRALLLQVVDYYNESLKQSPEAMKYLESRGLKSSEMIDRFQLGFANRTLGYRLPAKNRAAVIRRDLGRVLLKLEEMQDEQIKQALAPKEEAFTLSDQQRAEAMELLRDPRLLERIVEDFARCGVVGEETNKLVGYLGAVSRHLEAPLAVIVQSSSAAGKSSLMEAVLAFLPEEQRVQYSAMTGQSLFYMGETDLKHKVLAIVEEEGAHSATYALKLLQSEGVLTIASTGKDPATGRLLTHQYRVEGPVMIFLTTTAINLDEEMLNRCLVLTVNEDREQTQAIHRVQREAQTLEGLLQRRDRDAILAVHRNAQRLLKPVFVVNPYARELTFLDSQTRTRRDHMKYLTLIRSIALLHQWQRPHKTVQHRGRAVEYIEVTLDDIATANRLAHEVLGRSLDDLPPQTRRLLLAIDIMVTAECVRQKMERPDYRFSRRDVREATCWGDTQLKIHLHRLEELEYLLVHRGGRGQSFVYELAFARQPDSGRPMLSGLIDIESLRKHGYEEKKSGAAGQLSGSSRPQVGGVSGVVKTISAPMPMRVPEDTEFEIEESTYTDAQRNGHYVLTVQGR